VTCVNSCPHLNPNTLQMLQQDLARDQLLSSYLTPVLQATADDLKAITALVTLVGPVSFSIPAGTWASVVATVVSSITNTLPSFVTYSLKTNVCCLCRLSFSTAREIHLLIFSRNLFLFLVRYLYLHH
jgi:hypothetical protein